MPAHCSPPASKPFPTGEALSPWNAFLFPTESAIMRLMNQNAPRYPLTPWRLLVTPPSPGPWNMAVDSAVLESTASGGSLPTLRLYSWKPPCLSLGYAQPLTDVDQEALAKRSWDLVRRPTGGRAILHTEELTYAVIGPRDDPRLAGGVLTSYRRLATALFSALRSLGLPVQVQQSRDPDADPKQPICFENPSDYEITVKGKKLVGSAQARKQGGVLQHGSLPLRGDLTRITQVLNFPTPAARKQAAERLLNRAATVEEILDRKISWEEAAQAFQDAFRAELNLELHPQGLTPQEQKGVEKHLKEYQQRS